ncbi:MAG: hypothetical protein K2O69_01240 [Odoribacter sp.]|nr:hypothetical protein [Odoribacter sp.]
MFITQGGVVYTAYFIDISQAFGSDCVYTFSFDAAGKAAKDERVRITILKILNDFFQSARNALLVVCDSCDKREKSRFRLFQKWYEAVVDSEIEKVDVSIDLEECTIYSSLLLSRNHPQADEVKNLFNEWVNMGI